jgi:pimeloyl-ACP methyl ester carboxylesterase
MPFTENDGVRLHWDEKGEGSPLLLVMGHRYSSRMWYPAIPALSARHRVIWFDNRGTGESGATRKVSVRQLAEDAFAVMDAAGVDKAHIYGVSMGGVIVQEMALQAPERVRSLTVGCSGPLTADKPRMPKLMAYLHYLPPSLLKVLLPQRPGGAHGSAANPEAVAYDEAMVAADKFSVRGVIAQSHALADYCTTREELAGLEMPALVIHGDEDALVPIKWGQELAEILPNSTFVTIAGAGHNYIIVDPAKANGAVLDFIRGAEAAGV